VLAEGLGDVQPRGFSETSAIVASPTTTD